MTVLVATIPAAMLADWKLAVKVLAEKATCQISRE
jgi:hypothetical protein